MKKLVLIALLTVLATACAKKEPTQSKIGMANPASVYCESVGGKSQIIDDPKGQYGVCHLPNGTTVEEWQLYRSKNK